MPGTPRHAETFRFRLKSGTSQPFRELSVWQRGLLFAECAWLGTHHPRICREQARGMGFEDAQPIHHERALATWFHTEQDSLILFRHGHQPTIWKDIRSAAQSGLTPSDTAGKVHQELNRLANTIWPVVEQTLSDDGRPLWFAGYSRGAVIATLCALKCVVAPLRNQPEELHTFGSPRPGNRVFSDALEIPHHRWVNERDLVPHLPPSWHGYRHHGSEHLINQYGNLQGRPKWKSWLESVSDARHLVGIRDGRVLIDHSMDAYVEGLFNIVRQKGLKPAP